MPSEGRGGRGRGAPSQHVSEVHHEEHDPFDEGEDEEDGDYGSDSDNDDALSVMDPDAVRAAMGARSGTGGGTAGPAEYVVEFEVSRGFGRGADSEGGAALQSAQSKDHMSHHDGTGAIAWGRLNQYM